MDLEPERELLVCGRPRLSRACCGEKLLDLTIVTPRLHLVKVSSSVSNTNVKQCPSRRPGPTAPVPVSRALLVSGGMRGAGPAGLGQPVPGPGTRSSNQPAPGTGQQITSAATNRPAGGEPGAAGRCCPPRLVLAPGRTGLWHTNRNKLVDSGRTILEMAIGRSWPYARNMHSSAGSVSFRW